MLHKCPPLLTTNDFTVREATPADKDTLAYMSEYTGWQEKSADPAQELLDHSELPTEGVKENDRVYLLYAEKPSLVTANFTGACEGTLKYISTFSVFSSPANTTAWGKRFTITS